MAHRHITGRSEPNVARRRRSYAREVFARRSRGLAGRRVCRRYGVVGVIRS